MTTQTLVKKLNKEVSTLRRDMEIVKKAVFAGYRDPEGEYRPSFVKKMLKREKERPIYRFTTKEAFLKHVRAGKK